MIDIFEGKYAFLSNFEKSVIVGVDDKIEYPTVEHYFQAHKSLDFKDRITIASAPTPGKAKRLGRSVKLRNDWEEVKDAVMLEALRLKFSDKKLRKKLLETGDDYLIEGNSWHDNYWGMCFCRKCGEGKISGKNHLGQLLMKVRAECRNQQEGQ